MDNERLRILLHRYMMQSMTAAEESELMQIIASPGQEPAIKEELGELWDQWQAQHLLSKEESDELYTGILQAVAVEPSHRTRPATIRVWWRLTAAAAVILFLAVGIYIWVNQSHKPGLATQENRPKNDVAPGGNKAVLTLANGQAIILDSAANGVLAQQGGAKVLKTNNGQLAYTTTHEKPTEVLYNTLATPRGGQYQLVLPDGSKVWLNAASSIRYPTAFTGAERKVDITGEAYLEVAKNAAMPFMVRIGSPVGSRGEIKVLGTGFNVNGYDDEPLVRTTLVEGAVQVKKDAASAILKPGQQSQLSGSGRLTVVNNADVEEVLAWKNGKLLFRHASMEAILRQAARWYDVDVQFKEKIEEEPYTVSVPRNVPLSQMLEALEVTGGVHFTIEGKTIVVTK